jgi:phosphotransferase system HPr (HPr) family protein
MSASSDEAVRRAVVLPAGVDLHARPAGEVVRAAAALDARVVLCAGGKAANAASILQVLALGATGGSEIVVEASGGDAEAAAEAIAALIAGLR